MASLVTLLLALQSQLNTLQGDCGIIKSDVKDALFTLTTIRTQQAQTDKRISTLENVIGIEPDCTMTMVQGHATTRCAKRRNTQGATTEPAAHDQAPAETPTLIHTLSCIQASVDQLLHREKETPPPPHPVIRRAVATSPFPSPPTPPASLPAVDSTMDLSIFEHPPLLPPSPAAIHTHNPPTPSAQPVPERSFVEASIQACPPSPPPETPCTLRRSLTLTPVDWNANPMTHLAKFRNSARPSAYTAEYMTRFARDAEQVTNQTSANIHADPNANAVIHRDQTRTRAPDSDSDSDSEMVTVDDLRRLIMDAVTVTKPASVGMTSVPNVSQEQGLGMEARTSGTMSVQNRLCDEGSSSQEKRTKVGGVDVDGGMESQATPPRHRRPSMPMVEAGPADTLNSGGIPVSGSELEASRGEPEEDRMGMDMNFEQDRDCDEVPPMTDPEFTSPMTPRLDDGDRGCLSGLPTPPSDEPTPGPSMFTSLGVVRLAPEAEVGHGSNVGRGGHSSCGVAVIVTPPAVTPPPSLGSRAGEEEHEEQGGDEQGENVIVGNEGVGGKGGLGSSLTPPPPSPFVGRRAEVGVDEDQDGREINRMQGRLVDHQGTRENGIDIGVDEQVDTPTSQSPRSDPVDTSTPTPSSSDPIPVIPAITVTQDSRSATPPDTEKDQNALADGDPEIIHPSSSAGFSDLELFKFQPDFSTAHHYHLTLECPAPCPSASPPASATGSRYHTPTPIPSEATSSHVTQDEEEVWDALVLGRSGVSTPASILYGMYSRGASVLPTATVTETAAQPGSEARQEMLSIDPSILQLVRGRPPLPSPPPPPERSSPRLSEASPLSSLTSLADEMDVDGEAEKDGVTIDAIIHDDDDKRTTATRRSERLGHDRDRNARLCSMSPTSTRAVSEMTSGPGSGSRPLGGPSASLEELALLARRRPLKIRIKVPEGMKGVKRKWREVGGGGSNEDDDDGNVDADAGEDDDDGNVDADAGQEECRETTVLTEMSEEEEAPQAFLDVGVALTTPAPTPTPPAFPAPGVNAHPYPPKTHTLEDALPIVPRKKFKHAPPQGSAKNGVRSRKKTVKQGSKPYFTYYVQNGEVVMAEPESAPTPCPTVATPPQEAHVTNAMKTPPDSPVRPPPACSSSYRPTKMTASPTKADVWSKMGLGDGTWSTLPSVFSRWDEQFIQCDNCDLWYHYGCVGIEEEDPRLDEGALFICPTCQTQSAKRRAQRKNNDTCVRPDCPKPVVSTDNFIVERLVGRKRIGDGVYHWLAKWEGYPMSQASWIPEENVTSGGRTLFVTFEADAAAEGVDLSELSVLLEEAVDAGWDNYT